LRLISTAHYMLEGDVKMNIVEYSDNPEVGAVFINVTDNGGYPNIIFSTTEVNRNKWARAIAAFNAIMGELNAD